MDIGRHPHPFHCTSAGAPVGCDGLGESVGETPCQPFFSPELRLLMEAEVGGSKALWRTRKPLAQPFRFEATDIRREDCDSVPLEQNSSSSDVWLGIRHAYQLHVREVEIPRNQRDLHIISSPLCHPATFS